MNTKKKTLKITIMFIIFMMVFTIISRTADNLSVAKVSVGNLKKQKISHDIKVQGQITTNNEIVVATLENQLIKSMNVREGQAVDAGSVLFTVDEERLEQQITKLEAGLADTKEKKNKARSRAREDYNAAVNSASITVSEAETAMNEAYSDYEIYSKEEDGYDELSATELYHIFEEKKQIYETALTESEANIRNAKRALEDSEVNEYQNESESNLASQEHLAKLQELKDQKGQILAPSDGIVSRIAEETGAITTDGAIIVLGSTGTELSIAIQIPVSSSEYINETSKIKAETLGSTKQTKSVDDLVINSQQLNLEQPEFIDARIIVPNGIFEVGTIVNVTIQNSNQEYDLCFPLQALRQDEVNKYYVLVLKEKKTVLGEELIAKKVAVTVIDKNDSFVAVDEESIAVDNEIIIESNKDIEDNSRVKRIVL